MKRLWTKPSLRFPQWVSLCLGTSSLCAVLLASPQPDQPQKVRVLTLLGRPLQFVVADRLGLFTKHGVEVQTENKKNSDELRADLAAGNGDLAYLAVDNAVAMKRIPATTGGHLAGPDGIVLDPDHHYFVVLRVEYAR